MTRVLQITTWNKVFHTILHNSFHSNKPGEKHIWRKINKNQTLSNSWQIFWKWNTSNGTVRSPLMLAIKFKFLLLFNYSQFCWLVYFFSPAANFSVKKKMKWEKTFWANLHSSATGEYLCSISSCLRRLILEALINQSMTFNILLVYEPSHFIDSLLVNPIKIGTIWWFLEWLAISLSQSSIHFKSSSIMEFVIFD